MDELAKPTLLACPFCSAGETQIKPQNYWTGMRNTVISVSVYHWCKRQEGQPQSHIEIKGKTEEDAVKAWNTREHRD
jgi:hypothetical protein